ncbi:hypothetical protein KCV01_g19863, partial [Aureobasidium melanogenum]
AYKKEQRRLRDLKRAEMKAQDPDDFSDFGSFVSESSFHSDSEYGDDTTAEEVLDKLCATLRGMYKRGVKPSDPEFKAVLEKVQDVNEIIEFDESDADSVFTTEMPEPNWNIKLDENMKLTLLDFDNDPFLSPADEKYLDDVQGCFNTRDIRIAEEILARFAKLADGYGKDKNQLQKDKKEHDRLMILFNRLGERLDASKQGNSGDDQAEDDEETSDDNGEDGSDDPENKPDWLRNVSKKIRLIIEAPDMDINPKHVNISSMTDEEEVEYFARIHQPDRTEREQFEIEDERKLRIAQEIKDKGNKIQWLHTRDREDFPTSPRISTSSQAASLPVPTEEAFAHHQERSKGQKLSPCLFDGQTLKCFSAGPHHTREEESSESSSASSNKKPLVDRGAEKIARGIKKFKKLGSKVLFPDDSSGYSRVSNDSVVC